MTESIERARRGDRAALAALVERLRPRLEKMAVYYARRTGEEADDLLQEAWLGVLDSLPALDIRIGSPEQHLIQRARWRLLDAVKRQRVRRCASLEETRTEPIGPGAEECALGRASVGEFLEQLPGPQRAVLDCLLEGLTWREAGAVLGCTSANVAYHMRRVRRRYESWTSSI